MGRRPLFTKKDFLRARKKAGSVRELARALHVTIPTVYNAMNKYGAKPYTPEGSSIKLKDLVNQYKHGVTVFDLAKKFNCSSSTVRYYLMKVIEYSDKYPFFGRMPHPRTLVDIKIINALRASKQRLDNPALLLVIPRLSKEKINSYWEYAFGCKAFTTT